MRVKSIVVLQELVRAIGVAGLVVAGGAVRDAFIGAPAKDIDILVENPFEPTSEARIVEAVEKATKRKLVRQVGEANDYKFVLYRSEDSKIDLVMVPMDEIEYIEDFDDDLSRMWVDSDGFHAMPEALAAWESRVITVKAAAEQRYNKLVAKFGGEYKVQYAA